MNSGERPSLSIIGAGKVGSTLARLWTQAGYAVYAVHSRTQQHAHHLAAQLKAQVAQTPDEAVNLADLTVLAVPDDAIEEIAARINIADLSDKGIVHTSGASDASSLAVLEQRGAMTGSLHPAFPFADVDSSLTHLPSATFAVEAVDERLREWLNGLVAALHGQVLAIPPGGKSAYHAALVIASNYTVTLYAIAERLLTGLGVERQVADQTLNTLLAGTAENLRRQGIPDALTGPLTRQDTGTIAKHLEALAQVDSQWVEMYEQLAKLTLPLLRARGIPTQRIEDLLQRWEESRA